MNTATQKLYDNQISAVLRRECFDYAMAFGCPLCECNITEESTSEYVIVAGRSFPVLGLLDGTQLIHFGSLDSMGVIEDRYVAVCDKCYPRLATPDGLGELSDKVN